MYDVSESVSVSYPDTTARKVSVSYLDTKSGEVCVSYLDTFKKYLWTPLAFFYIYSNFGKMADPQILPLGAESEDSETINKIAS